MNTTKMTDLDFFLNHLNLEVSAFSEIEALAASGNFVRAKAIFANYIREFLREKFDFSECRKKLLSSAEKIKIEAERVKGRTLISCRVPYTFGEKIDWAHNPTYNNYKEWPWLLNRHHDWNYLAKHYIISGDESFAKEWVYQFLGWIDQAQCPEKIVNEGTGTRSENACWRTLEASIRMPIWNYLIKVFSVSEYVDDNVITEFFKSVCEHGNHLMKTTSERNFILHEMGSLAQIGFWYPFLKNSSLWLEFANERLEKEVDVQVYPDGMHYEMSIHYHEGCLRQYFDVYNMYVNAGKIPPEYTLKAMERMYGAYVKMARPDFFCPTMNDGDGVVADDALRDVVDIFPNRCDFKYFATRRIEGCPPDCQSCFREYSGIVAMRSDWSENAVWAYMDASPLGYGHHHDDRHNIQMYAYGHELLIEAGNFDYDTSEMRRYVTSSRGHNCSSIDGLEQNMRKNYKRRPGITSIKSDSKWYSSENRDSIESFYCYGYGEEPLLYVDWTRKLIFLKKEENLPPIFVVIDRFAAKDSEVHDYELIWHMHDNPTIISKNTVINTFSDGVGISISSSDGTASVVRGVKTPVYQGWLPKFGIGDVEHYPIPTILNKGQFLGSCRIVTVLEPFEKNLSVISGVEASNDFSSKNFELILKDGSRVELME